MDKALDEQNIQDFKRVFDQMGIREAEELMELLLESLQARQPDRPLDQDTVRSLVEALNQKIVARKRELRLVHPKR